MIFLRYFSFLLLLISIPIFFFGFLPKTTYKNHQIKDRNYFQQRTIDKVILVVIDSLRPDMVFAKKEMWISVQDTISRSWAYQTIAKLQPPSMSLPKIKCIITGAMINFIDTIFNTDAGIMAQENLIDILKEHRNFKINLYGDETWEKLFPHKFNHSYAIPPFFVRDFFESDEKISKNIPKILSDFDAWDFVIMHYLGLDHIGHSVGPHSSFVDSKLLELDGKVGSLLDGVFRRSSNERTLVILTADHGMSDLGGHGGSSKEELHVPLIFFNKKLRHQPPLIVESLFQNDIAPSLALLLGVPIPADSIGVIAFPLLNLIDGDIHRTDALFSNYRQLSRSVKKLPTSIEKRFSEVNSSIFKSQQICTNNLSSTCSKDLQNHHKTLIHIMNDMKGILQNQSIHHNFLMMEFALMLVTVSFILNFSFSLTDMGFPITVAGILFSLSTMSLLMSCLFLENSRSCLFSAFKISINILLLILTGYSVTGVSNIFRFVMSLNLEQHMAENAVILSLFINFISPMLPCLIQEEHVVWFYISSTITYMYIVKEIVQRLIIKKETPTVKSTYVAASVILVSDRLLRTLNRTGEQWSSIPDVSDWLNGPANTLYLVTVILGCLLLLGILKWNCYHPFLSITTQILMIFNALHRVSDIHKHRLLSDLSAWTYYALVVIQIAFVIMMKCCFTINNIFKCSNIVFLISVLVCRDQNVLLWTAIAVKTLLIRHIWLEDIQHYNVAAQFCIFNALGMISYYQQGNSNSLTSIDALPGFVGLPYYISWIVNPLVAVQLFSGNMYWITVWLEWLSEQHTNDNGLPMINKEEDAIPKTKYGIKDPDRPNISFSKILLFLTMLSSIFTISLFLSSVLHKHTILTWSIYAPKLLYHCFHYGFTLILYIFIAKLYFL